MAMFRLDGEQLVREIPATFSELNIYERGDLQRLLRNQPDALGEDLLIISEEFGQWQDSQRRIDLLALDTNARLVVIELKRTADGGHMDLQALRYAAMVSSMSPDELLSALADFRARRLGGPVDIGAARTAVAEFLGLDGDVLLLSSDVRIMLVSADFGTEITTAVLWLNRFEGMDVRCIRLKPYRVDGTVLIDIDQVIPLPEAAEYQVRIGRKDAARARQTGTDNRDFTKYLIRDADDETGPFNKRNSVLEMVQVLRNRGVSIAAIREVLPDRMFRSVDGELQGGEDVSAALLVRTPDLDLGRYFVDRPFHDEGQTHILFKMWGRNTGPSLESLSKLVPDGSVAYRASADGE